MGAGPVGTRCCARKTNHGLCANKCSALIPYTLKGASSW